MEREYQPIDLGFWRGRKVFLTGHTGFKGGWLTTWLSEMGAEITGYALPPSDDRTIYSLCRLERRVHSILADVRDGARLASEMAQAQPSVVFHLAAQPLVRLSYREPQETFAVNLMGTVNFLEALKKLPAVRAAVIITSDKCYENREQLQSYSEDDPLGGHDPYSASKACAEMAVSAYRRSFFEPAGTTGLASVRAGNVIGGGDWSPDRLVPDAIAALHGGRPLIVRNPDAVRPWQHVIEPLAGYLLLAQRLYLDPAHYAQAWNFGPSDQDEVTVAALAERLVRLWGSGSWQRTPGGMAGPHEARLLKLNSGRAHELLGWRPRLGLDTAIELTVSWYRAALAGGDIEAVSRSQLRFYQDLMLLDRA